MLQQNIVTDFFCNVTIKRNIKQYHNLYLSVAIFRRIK